METALKSFEALFSEAESVGKDAMDLLLELRPELRKRYDDRSMRLAREDMAHHIRNLAAAALSKDEAPLVDYLAWLKVLFGGLGFSDDDVALSFRCAGKAACSRLVAPEAAIFGDIVERAAFEYRRSEPESNRYLLEALPDNGVARAYVQTLVDGHRDIAATLVESMIRDGATVSGLYLKLFQPALREVGRLWHMRKISVAQEHFATAATQYIISTLYERLLEDSRPNGKRMIAACAQGELHELGLRMVADYFQADGWDTRFLGANLPIDALVAEVSREGADLVALSASTQPNVRWVGQAIEALRDLGGTQMTILVGGLPFLISSELWRDIGADATGVDCKAATLVGDRLAGLEPSLWLGEDL